MKNKFSGFYAPSIDEYKRLWNEGIIVLDTNVLLDLYRLPATARDELIAVLEIVKDRLWVPYQVALEFQRRRLAVIASEKKKTEEALAEAKKLFDDLEEKVSNLQIEKRGLGIDSEPIIVGLAAAKATLVETLDSVHRAQIDIAVLDPIRDRIDALLSGKIGDEPKDQADLDELISGGELRYERKIPPGFEDTLKEKNPAEAKFYHDDLCYERKFGDLILWRQFMRHAKNESCKVAFFVTSDRKDDWWWREKGRTVGPRPELGREVKKVAGVDLFWMYSSVQFLESAKSFTEASVSQSSVDELKEVVRTSSERKNIIRSFHKRSNTNRNFESNLFSLGDREVENARSIQFRAKKAVFRWLQSGFENIKTFGDFPDFALFDEIERRGFVVRYSPDFLALLSHDNLLSIYEQALGALRDGFHRVTIILVTDGNDSRNIESSRMSAEAEERISIIRKLHGSIDVILGVLDDFGRFTPVGPWSAV